jgi:ribosomal protein L18
MKAASQQFYLFQIRLVMAPRIELDRKPAPNDIRVCVHTVDNAIHVQVVSGVELNVLVVDAADKVGKRALPDHVLDAAADVGAVVAFVRGATLD